MDHDQWLMRELDHVHTRMDDLMEAMRQIGERVAHIEAERGAHRHSVVSILEVIKTYRVELVLVVAFVSMMTGSLTWEQITQALTALGNGP